MADELKEQDGERPTFKVTDRRIFNPDGTLREGVQLEEPSQPQTAPAEEKRAEAQDEGRQESVPTGDPRDFIELVMFIASPAAAALGLDPSGISQGIDLQLAKHCIDLLGTLQRKTQGRLSLQERQVLEDVLAQLRMQYVALSSGGRRSAAGPKRGGGFSGSDITGR
ncbi:MAG: hypothetical protein C4334_10670 [Pyrinomonas sp.]|uniref:DUF1844 domain-containing protein n=1 Tax=Pyrinomonas sp. TaxID=2080306 RepID=UPI003322505D